MHLINVNLLLFLLIIPSVGTILIISIISQSKISNQCVSMVSLLNAEPPIILGKI